MRTEVIKADKVNQYIKARKELNTVLHETDFLHPFILWKSNETTYHIWYPIKELNDKIRIQKAWKAFAEHHERDVLKPVQECIETSTDQIMLAYNHLAYEPDGHTSEEQEPNFCRMKQLYLKQGCTQELKAHNKKIVELFQSKNVARNFYCGEGSLGFETPVMLYWSFAKDKQDYLQKEARIKEFLGDDYQEINQEISNHVRKTINVDFWYMDELSYYIY